MIFKPILLLALCAACSALPSHSSNHQPKSTESSEDELLNDIVDLFSTALKPVIQYATNTLHEYQGLLTALGLRTELFFCTNGEHFLPSRLIKDTADDMDHHMIAKAIQEMTQALPTMEKIDEILIKVTDEVSRDVVQQKSKNMLHEMFEKLASEIKADSELSPTFERIRRKLQLQYSSSANSLHPTQEVQTDMIEKIQKYMLAPQMHNMILSRLFLKRSKSRLAVLVNAEEGSRFRLANALLQLSKQPEFNDKVQRLYNEAVASVPLNADSWYKQTEMVNQLFDVLQKKVNADPSLKKNIEQIKGTVQISASDFGKYEIDIPF